MAVRISQVDDHESGRTTLRVEGLLTREDAQLLENMCHDALTRLGHSVVIDLKDLTCLDDHSAAILFSLKQQPGVALEGCQLFTQQMIEASATRR